MDARSPLDVGEVEVAAGLVVVAEGLRVAVAGDMAAAVTARAITAQGGEEERGRMFAKLPVLARIVNPMPPVAMAVTSSRDSRLGEGPSTAFGSAVALRSAQPRTELCPLLACLGNLAHIQSLYCPVIAKRRGIRASRECVGAR